MNQNIKYDQENNRYVLASLFYPLTIEVSPEELGRARYQKTNEKQMQGNIQRQYQADATHVRNYQGQRFGEWRVLEYKADTDTYFIQHIGGKVEGATSEFIQAQIEREKHINKYTGKFVMPIPDEHLKQNGTISWSGIQQAINPTLAHKMTRLTSYEDWTILLGNDNKLIAVNSKGNTLYAKGSLLSAGGRAWMYTHSQLWSGELERHETEQETRFNAAREAEQKVYLKFQKKLNAVAEKESKLIDARDKALRDI